MNDIGGSDTIDGLRKRKRIFIYAESCDGVGNNLDPAVRRVLWVL